MNKKPYVVGPEVYTDEWYKLRVFDSTCKNPLVVFGASDAAALLGVSKYRSRLELYNEKAGLVEPREATFQMKLGRRLERLILDLYEEDTGYSVTTPNRLWIMESMPYIGASLDGFVDAERIVEAKASSRFMYKPGDDGTDFFTTEDDGIPLEYAMQVQQQMLVSGAEIADVPVLFDHTRFVIYSVKRDERVCDLIKKAATEMLDRIVRRDPPEINVDRKGALEEIKRTYGVNHDECTLPSEFHDIAAAVISGKADIRAMKVENDANMARLLQAMGDFSVARIAGSPHVLKRSKTAPTFWTQQDVDKISVGALKRSGFTRVSVK